MLGEARKKRSFTMRQLRGLRGRFAECLRSALSEAKPSLPPYEAERTSV